MRWWKWKEAKASWQAPVWYSIRYPSFGFTAITSRSNIQLIGAFAYHFWSKYMPKISDYQKKEEPAPIELVIGEKPRKKVLETVRAIEMHMLLSCIAIGILQCLSICFIGKINSNQIRYQRTPSRGRISEAALMHYFQKHFFRLLWQKPKLSITQIIHGLQKESAKP